MPAISAAKNRPRGSADATPVSTPQTPALAAVFARYDAALRASQAVDFDDLVALPVQLLEQHRDVLAALHARYRWLSVDEYQDVNLAQVRLLSLLAAGGANLCVIGDPDQAIYGFRGADYRYFQRFHDDYPNAMRYQLTQNYRSAQHILDAAMQVIGHNPDRTAMQIWSEFVDDVKLDVRAAATDKAEAEQVVHQIEQLVGGTSYFSLDSGRVDGAARGPMRSFADFAVLYRLGAQARLFVEALDRSGIPYQSVGPSLFYGRKAISTALALLWLQINPSSAVHLSILLTARRNDFSSAALQNLHHQLRTAETPLPQALRAAAAAGGFTTAQRRRLLECAQALESLHQTAANAAPAVAQLAASAYQLGAELRGVKVEPEDELLRELIARTIPYGARLLDFLAFAALQSEADGYDPRADRVTLMSLHAAKGLEFPVVFIAGCEEGLLPYLRVEEKDQNEDPVAEERRLFYVGLTRARERILLSHARRRFLFGRHMENPSSRFLDEIEEALKRVPPREPLRPQPRRSAGEQMTLF
ncbi:MAG: UvrD-helicase domain-containing protein [Anaerolineales bacterium]|nr:UvrD-helicase domain-containing protein [Anaerolineales bacterium]